MFSRHTISSIISICLILVAFLGFTRDSSIWDFVIPICLAMAVALSVISIVGFRKNAKIKKDSTLLVNTLHNLNYVVIFIVLLVGLFLLIISNGLPPQD